MFSIFARSSALLSVAWGSGDLGPTSMSLTVGTPGVTFHRVANWVVVRGLERLGYTVTVVDNLPHREMYPMFTGSNGQTVTIDLVTGSDLPYNHIRFLHPDICPTSTPPNWRPKLWSVMGTVNEATDIVVAAPAAASLSSVGDLMSVDASFHRTIVGLDQDTCPACVVNGEALVHALGDGWSYKPYNSTAFVDAVKAKLAAGESNFAAVWYVPTYLNAELKALVNLDGTPPWPKTTTNQGKVIIRNDRVHKLTQQARNFLGAAYIGDKHMVTMGLWVHQGMTAKAAALKWIGENPNIFGMCLGEFNVTNVKAAEEHGYTVTV